MRAKMKVATCFLALFSVAAVLPSVSNAQSGQVSRQCTHADTDTFLGGEVELPCQEGAHCVAVLPVCLDKNFQITSNCQFRQGHVLGCVEEVVEDICTGTPANGFDTDVSNLICPTFWTHPDGGMAVLSPTYFPGAVKTTPRGHCRVAEVNGDLVNQCAYLFPTPPASGCTNGYRRPSGAQVCSIAPTACWNMADAAVNFCAAPTDNSKPVHGWCLPTSEAGYGACQCNQYQDKDGRTFSFQGCPPNFPSCSEFCYNKCEVQSDGTCKNIQENGGGGTGGSDSGGGASRPPPGAAPPPPNAPSPPSPPSNGGGGSGSNSGGGGAQPTNGGANQNESPGGSGDSDSGSSSALTTVLIVAGIFAAVAVVVGVAFYLRREKRRRDEEEEDLLSTDENMDFAAM